MEKQIHRLRRLRRLAALRDLVQETHLQISDFIYPLFIHHAVISKKAIASMPGQYQWGLEGLKEEIPHLMNLGIKAVLLFGIPSHKDAHGTQSYQDEGIIQQAIQLIKQIAPQLLVITDVCFCEYTDHGHCGIVNERTGVRDVDNDATLELLVKQAISHVQAGAAMVAPSGSLDGMVKALRTGLDSAGFEYIPILSYSVKYCSALYSPFREAAEGAPQFGNRATYQMDPANSQEALREAEQDIVEGADLLMVKPAGFYLDILAKLKQHYPTLPLVAYQVSGEYAMLKAAISQNGFDEKTLVLESLLAIKRAGANIIISYYAKDVASWLTLNN